MTVRQKIQEYLKGQPGAKPSQVARDLGLVASSVRREMAQLSKRPDYRPSEDSLSGQIVAAIREFGAGEDIGLRQLIARLPKGQYSAEELILSANRRRSPSISLQSLYLTIDAKQTAIRSRLSELLARGIVKRTEAGRYAIETVTYSISDLPESDRKSGWRIWEEKDGSVNCAVFDPEVRYTAKPMRQQRKIDQTRAFGLSKSDQGDVPVLGLGYGSDVIVRDYDSRDIPIDPLAIAIQMTENGYHLYFDKENPGNGEYSDGMYESISQQRGIYQERLFNRDGTPRDQLISLGPKGEKFVKEHNEALRKAQALSIIQRFGR